MERQVTAIRSDFVSKCADMVKRSAGLRDVPHDGLRGALRELVVSTVLSAVIPPEVKIGTGLLVNAAGKSSPQTDLILYSPAVSPPLLYDYRSGVFPFESALYTIEIKSVLNRTELRQSITNARSTMMLESLPTEHWRATGSPEEIVTAMESGTPNPVMCLFALDSDLTSDPQNEFKRYMEEDEFAFAPDVRSAFGAICIVGRGYFYRTRSGWRYMAPSEDFNEVAAFVAGLVNTLPQLLAAKGRPRFGNYLMPDAPFFEFRPNPVA